MDMEEQLFIKDTNQLLDIPPEGCLGLLALGDIGLKIWREKVKEAKAKEGTEQKPDEKNKTNE
jgi:hypothetical protein